MSEKSMDSAQIEREAYDWMRCFASGAGRSSDLAGLKQWCARSRTHREAFERVSRTWRDLGVAGTAFPDRSEIQVRQSPARVDRRIFLGGALAASAAGTAMIIDPPLGLWPSWSELSADYRTKPGERRRVALSDGASIEMNTRTSIALRSGNGQPSRVELISGEATISTASKGGALVTVVAGDGRIVALNARFNVRYDDRSVCVTCLEGEVRIERLKAILPLLAGRQVVYSDRGIGSTVAIDAASVMAWQHGLVIFRSAPITEVVAEINRYRPGRIILTNSALGQRRLNARFRIEDMDKVVGQIEQVFGAHATMLPYGLVLLG